MGINPARGQYYLSDRLVLVVLSIDHRSADLVRFYLHVMHVRLYLKSHSSSSSSSLSLRPCWLNTPSQPRKMWSHRVTPGEDAWASGQDVTGYAHVGEEKAPPARFRLIPPRTLVQLS